MPRRFCCLAALLTVATMSFLAPVAAASSPLPPLPLPAELPLTIAVGRTYSTACVRPARGIPVQHVLFVDYVRNVLPNEWSASFPAASLDAGAIAAKQFALTMLLDGKWRRQGYAFDVVDSTCDQVYRDRSTHPTTDAAVARTWDLVVTRDGGLPRLYFRAYDTQCAGVPDCMGQVDSAYLAQHAWSTQRILERYYSAPGTAFALTPLGAPAAVTPAPTSQLRMPSLAGLGENQARDRLAVLGVRHVLVDYQSKNQLGDRFDAVPAYVVVSHLPPPDAVVDLETVVVLGVRAP